MRKKKTNSGSWGWDPSTEAQPHGIERMKEVRNRIATARAEDDEESLEDREERIKAGDVNTTAEYHEAVAKGYDKLWDKEEQVELNAMGVPKKRGLLDQPLVSEMGPERVATKPYTPVAQSRTPHHYLYQAGKYIPVYEADEEEDYGVSRFDDSYYNRYGFGQQRLGFGGHGQGYISDTERGRADRYKEGLGAAYDDWGYGYQEYKKTGVWNGYSAYRAPTLSYRYIEQMANVIAGHYDVNIQPGEAWDVDIPNKKLTYNPLSLVSGTKADLLLTLLHEVGHIINTTPNSMLKAQAPFDWKDPIGKALFEVPAVFEDLRNDAIMREQHDGADEIYESAQEAPVRALAERLFNVAEAVRKFWIQEEERTLMEMNASVISLQAEIKARPENEMKIKKSIVSLVDDAFRIDTKEEMKDVAGRYKKVVEELDDDRRRRSELPNAFDYAGHMLLHAYGYQPKKGDKKAKAFEADIEPYLKATDPQVEIMKRAKTTQEMFDHMNATVTPEIQELIDRVMFPPTLKDMMSPKAIKNMQDRMRQKMQMSQETKEAGQQKMRQSDNSGQGDRMPSDWEDGDYQSLKDSVRNEIKTLVRFLSNIRREEQAAKMERHQKRGKLDGRSLYRFATGSTRLFKKKLPNVDTVRSFAFSVIIDTSGSMHGARIINSTRAAIAFAEAFQEVGIPMEIMRFDNDASIIKDFEVERMDKNQKAKIGGLVKSGGGATNVQYAFQKTKIKDRPERNKIMIIITDGGVGNPAALKKEYVDKFKQQGIQTYGYALDGYDEEITAFMEKGKGVNLESPAQMIPHFMGLLKTLMKTARAEMNKVNN